MAVLCFALALLALAAVLYAAAMPVPAAVCCGVGGAWMGYLLESS